MSEDFLRRYIVSFVPGRIRLRHPGLRGLEPDMIELVRGCVLALDGVTGCAINPRVGSLLLSWDPARLGVDELRSQLEAWQQFIPEPEEEEAKASCPAVCAGLSRGLDALSGAALDVLSPALTPRRAPGGYTRVVVQNRLMLGLGAAAVLSLSVRSGAHAAFGWAYLALTLAHLYRHRASL